VNKGYRAYLERAKKLTKQITHADLTDADTQQAIDFDSALPAGAFVIGAYAEVTTAMSGGSVSACTADLGIKSGDTDGLLDAANIFTGAPAKASVPRGVAVPGHHGGGTPTIIVDSTGDNLVNLTAGDVTFVLLYIDETMVR
ncbi:MAG: hypothetical protein GY842_00280, partial [bacterium]|nr:hypothetical protein [bacterium]